MLQPLRDRESLWLCSAGASLGHGGVNSSGPYVMAVSPSNQACPHPTATHQHLQKVQPYQLLQVGESKQDVPQQHGAQMKADWPDTPAKYARAAGAAFVFLLFINACIYLLCSPQIGREKGEAGSLMWDKPEGWCAACPRS